MRRRELTAGWETLDAFERLETKQEGIFVMPVEEIVIQSSYVYSSGSSESGGGSSVDAQLADLQHRYNSQAQELEKLRAAQLPG